MPIVENQTKQLLIIQKNSGPSIYLAPGEGALVENFEINGNTKIEKLVKTGAVAVKEETKTTLGAGKARPKKPSPKRNKLANTKRR